MNSAARAWSLTIKTASPAEPSFGSLMARVELFAMADRSEYAHAAMPWSLWRLIMKAAEDVKAARAIGGMIVTHELPAAGRCDSDGVRAAAAVRLGYTDRGLLVIEFLDERGAIIAYADLTPEQMANLIGQGCDLIEIVSKGGLATIECAGAG